MVCEWTPLEKAEPIAGAEVDKHLGIIVTVAI